MSVKDNKIEAQQGELNKKLIFFDEVLTKMLGKSIAACHVTNTG